jgi:intein-encoded DNA endonuclease-like protein
MKQKILEPYKDEVIKMYLEEGLNCTQIAKKFSIHKGTVGRFLRANNVTMKEMSHLKQKYKINENIFKKIDSNEKAYWLGLLYADGTNTPKCKEVKISLQEKDGYLIEGLKDFIGYSGPLFYIDYSRKHPTWQNQWALQVTNKKLSSDLETLGMGHLKTFTLKFPMWLEEKYYSHFIRGYFDGDGNIYINKNNNSAHFSMSGTINFLTEIQNILIKTFGFTKTKFQPVRTNHSKVKVLRYGGNHQVKTFGNWLYKDATIFLKRKQEKFDSIILQRQPKNKNLKNNI